MGVYNKIRIYQLNKRYIATPQMQGYTLIINVKQYQIAHLMFYIMPCLVNYIIWHDETLKCHYLLEPEKQ